jgi:DnaJ-class molecular chaperone
MDYYEILCVNKKSTPDEIKKAYRKLAVKYHPDKNSETEDKFKEINKAYQVLSDPSKKKLYDLTGSDETADAFNGFDPFNVFNSFFTNFEFDQFTFENNKKSKDLYYNINASLEDIYLKKEKIITLKHKRIIDGEYVDVPLQYKIPLYMRETIFRNEAHNVRGYSKRGDVIFNIFDKEHDVFKRINENDLIMTHTINLYDIYKGFSFKFKHLDGKEIVVKSEPKSLIEQGYFYQKIEGMGLHYDDEGHGDLIVRYIVNLPSIDKIEEICDGHDLDNEDYLEGDSKVAKSVLYEDIYKNMD